MQLRANLAMTCFGEIAQRLVAIGLRRDRIVYGIGWNEIEAAENLLRRRPGLLSW